MHLCELHAKLNAFGAFLLFCLDEPRAKKKEKGSSDRRRRRRDTSESEEDGAAATKSLFNSNLVWIFSTFSHMSTLQWCFR